MRVGLGYDIHRLIAGRPLILGGRHIPYGKGLLGHSDGDCLVHAVIDAILGALALGDIGQHFPDTDPRYKDAASLPLLEEVVVRMQNEGYAIGNVDIVVIAQEPKLAPHYPGIIASLKEVLRCAERQISVKSKTHERIGPLGAGEAIASFAVCTLQKMSQAIPIRAQA
ncbi:MAG: 2-C-methyl-D-erythritol 2,4-cyclodiphosphate synthase [Candidatus Omnitrophica bacterium]|nr:2-C-methyl-D-erythritol 2,4-cyclodiphosphate synthase [Candidatus Omnitrophota bacterium]